MILINQAKEEKGESNKIMIKKIIYYLLLLTTMLLTTGCSKEEEVQEPELTLEDVQAQMREAFGWETEEDIIEDEFNKDNATNIILGQTIVTETGEYTFTNAELTNSAVATNDGTFQKYTTEEDEVYIDISLTFKNLEKDKISSEDIISISADYNDGYTYIGFCVVDGSSGFNLFSNIIPLSTENLRYLIKCPAEVAETDNSLFLTTKLGDTDYIYTIR